MKRGAGILLHPTSLPSRFGIGDFGTEAFTWISMLKNANQKYWQFLPLGPTGAGDSPYQSLSSFAGNPLLISPSKLMEIGLLDQSDLDSYPSLSTERVDFCAVANEKEKLFRKAFSRFISKKEPDFMQFNNREKNWLDDFCLFCVIKKNQNNAAWNRWDEPLKLRNKQALSSVKKTYKAEIMYLAFLQYQFSKQWNEVKTYATTEGVTIIGDIPIYVALDSSDSWSAPELFEFDDACNPIRVSGVPPDYFSKTGQLWGNPLYRWNIMKQDGYSWWISRIKKALEYADLVRIDHFRGFESFWAVDAESETAMNGEWVNGPGIDFFNHLRVSCEGLPFIAEDLGDITEQVNKLRNDTNLPGMRVLQFAFDGNPDNPHLPYNFTPNTIIYTGTHDNDTTASWLNSLSDIDKQRITAYLGTGTSINTIDMIRLVYSSTPHVCIVPMQDVLGLGQEHRMNVPGVPSGNWGWRCPETLFTNDTLQTIKDFSAIYGRNQKTSVR